jgi:magnesium chelatase family protein
MAIAHIKTIGRLGVRCFPITIEVDVSAGLPSFNIVGLPDTVVQESKERIRSAIKNCGASFPLSRITVNLAPASIPKEGIGFDLPIAIGILAADRQLPELDTQTYFYGELGLQGELKLTRGVISVARHAKDARRLFISTANKFEAGLVKTDYAVFAVDSLQTCMMILKGESDGELVPYRDDSTLPTIANNYDFSEIHGQNAAKRALEIAASGHHNVLLSGPPGSGKTLLSRALPSIMPPLTRDEMLQSTEIYSITGLLGDDRPVITERPFRSPHHSASLASIVGGSNPPRPGEITLAHNGVLFLDEFAELPRNVIEALRQPLEDRVITVARAGYSAEYPAHCLLIAAVNPCPCGYKDDPRRMCVCSPNQILQYQKKLSGPILDRIDIHIVVPPVPVAELSHTNLAESSTDIRKRVTRARNIQLERYKNLSITTNSELTNRSIQSFCQLNPDAELLLNQAVEKLNLSARSYYKIIKLARTIADLDGEDDIPTSAVAEALQYRQVAVHV